MDWLMSPINRILDFLNEDIYPLFVDAFAYLVEQLTLMSIKSTIWSIGFGWDVSKSIIDDLGVSDQLNNAWSSLDSGTINVLTFFSIPEAIGMLVTAAVTAYTLKFIPFSGK
jgi:uncharacterized protein DUF2523